MVIDLKDAVAEDTLKEAVAVYKEIGLPIEMAINVFLRASVRDMGFPFTVGIYEKNAETLAALEEGDRIAHDPTVKGYTDMDELRAALEA